MLRLSCRTSGDLTMFRISIRNAWEGFGAYDAKSKTPNGIADDKGLLQVTNSPGDFHKRKDKKRCAQLDYEKKPQLKATHDWKKERDERSSRWVQQPSSLRLALR